MATTTGPEHTDSPYDEAWITPIGIHNYWYSHPPIDIKKNWQAFCRVFQETFDNQQSQPQEKLFLESITSASGDEIKTLALRTEQMTPKAYVDNAPDRRNAQMKDALVKSLDPQLARKKFASQKSTALEPQLPFSQLVE